MKRLHDCRFHAIDRPRTALKSSPKSRGACRRTRRRGIRRSPGKRSPRPATSIVICMEMSQPAVSGRRCVTPCRRSASSRNTNGRHWAIHRPIRHQRLLNVRERAIHLDTRQQRLTPPFPNPRQIVRHPRQHLGHMPHMHRDAPPAATARRYSADTPNPRPAPSRPRSPRCPSSCPTPSAPRFPDTSRKTSRRTRSRSPAPPSPPPSPRPPRSRSRGCCLTPSSRNPEQLS